MLALIGISNLVVIYFGGLMYINGSIKALEQLLNLFCTLICSRGLLLFRLGFVYGSGGRSFSKRLNEFLKIEPEIKIKTKTNQSLKALFENVRYTYEDTNITALQNISFTVKKERL
jgi:ATP-binding cassette subfamily B protein